MNRHSLFLSVFLLGILVLPVECGEAVSLFDGKSLSGWKPTDPVYWSVEDGAITAISSESNPCKKNQFLVWEGGNISDFVLTLKFRIEGGPSANSGVQVRSTMAEDGHAAGYQVDISQPELERLASIYDEHGRKMLATRGERNVIEKEGAITRESILESAEKAMKSYRAGEWNEYEITGKGDTISVKLNGHLTAGIRDLQESERELSGILALQLHSGPAMKVQFRDIALTTE
jgi:hypothetical protein